MIRLLSVPARPILARCGVRVTLALSLLGLAAHPVAQPATVRAHLKISDTEGGFGGGLGDDDFFGVAVADVGDLDGNGVTDLVVGAPTDDDGGDARGAVWVVFLGPGGAVQAEQKVSGSEGGFSGELRDLDFFGASVAATA